MNISKNYNTTLNNIIDNDNQLVSKYSDLDYYSLGLKI